jgi:DNA-binding response OmpR family regulator
VTRILIVDDDPFSRRFMEMTLHDAGWETRSASDGEAGWEAWDSTHPRPDLIVCDVRMPRLNGFELIERIRSVDGDVPIIAVSALGADDQVVRGLEAGADDYLAKPVSAAVLVAKVRAALRRLRAATPGTEGLLVVGELEMDESGSRFTRGGTPIALTRTELAMMAFLMRNAGRIVSPSQILGTVWGEAYEDENEILRTTVLRVRRKLEPDPANPRFLRTHMGLGYSLTGD